MCDYNFGDNNQRRETVLEISRRKFSKAKVKVMWLRNNRTQNEASTES